MHVNMVSEVKISSICSKCGAMNSGCRSDVVSKLEVSVFSRCCSSLDSKRDVKRVQSLLRHLELKFLFGCCRGFGAVTGVLVAAL